MTSASKEFDNDENTVRLLLGVVIPLRKNFMDYNFQLGLKIPVCVQIPLSECCDFCAVRIGSFSPDVQ